MLSLRRLRAAIVLAALASASFNLQTQGPDWDYTTKDLLNTTSQACRDAYAAEIDCDATLLGLVASMRPAFKPAASDLDRTCTTTCRISIDEYVENVQAACTAPGDLAKESLGGRGGLTYDPVAIVGEIFQYTLAQDCRKNSTNQYCYFYPYAGYSFDGRVNCSNECDLSFFATQAKHPASIKQFNYYYLISAGQYIEDEFQSGWPKLQECGMTVGAPTTSLNYVWATGTAAVSATGAGASRTSSGAALTASWSSSSTTTSSMRSPASSATIPTTSSSSASHLSVMGPLFRWTSGVCVVIIMRHS